MFGAKDKMNGIRTTKGTLDILNIQQCQCNPDCLLISPRLASNSLNSFIKFAFSLGLPQCFLSLKHFLSSSFVIPQYAFIHVLKRPINTTVLGALWTSPDLPFLLLLVMHSPDCERGE